MTSDARGLPVVHAAADYVRLARAVMRPELFAYVSVGAGTSSTVRRNRAAFARCLHWPRPLGDFRAAHTATHWLGRERVHPLVVAPLAWPHLAQPDGARALVAGARAVAAPVTLSAHVNVSLADAVAGAGDGVWCQLALDGDSGAARDRAAQAAALGCEAVVVTIDAAVTPPLPRALRAGFTAPGARSEVAGASRHGFLRGLAAAAPTWAHLERFVADAPLPVLVKGVLHPEDARRALACGAAGVVVSNHGGRVSDRAPATLDCIAAVRSAVGESALVFLDGGVRSGNDVFTALALGASGVGIGRLAYYALAVAGALGVAHMLRTLVEELQLAMLHAGAARLRDIDARCVSCTREAHRRAVAEG